MFRGLWHKSPGNECSVTALGIPTVLVLLNETFFKKTIVVRCSNVSETRVSVSPLCFIVKFHENQI